jgi:UDP-glucuronate 4-epimerase
MDFINQLEIGLGKTALKNYMPIQPGDVAKTWASQEKLKLITNYKPVVTLPDGIKVFADWFPWIF